MNYNMEGRLGEKHTQLDKIRMNRKEFRTIEVKGNSVLVVHGSLDSKIGRINNKLFTELQGVKI